MCTVCVIFIMRKVCNVYNVYNVCTSTLDGKFHCLAWREIKNTSVKYRGMNRMSTIPTALKVCKTHIVALLIRTVLQ